MQTAQGTWEVWVKPLAPSSRAVILAYTVWGGGIHYVNNLVALEQIANDQIQIINREEGEAFPFRWVWAGGSLPVGEWTHIVITQDGVAPKVYIDGRLVATVTAGNDLANWTLNKADYRWRIGSDYHSGTGSHFPFNGIICEIAIFDRALSADEIRARFEGGRP